MDGICLKHAVKRTVSAAFFAILTLALTLAFAGSFFSVSASSFGLDRIGALDTTGKVYPEWWYTATSPVFSGRASAGTTISVTAGGTTAEITANDQGAWSYASSLDAGDHTVAFTSSDGNYSFVLHVGETAPDFSTTAYSSTTPQTTGTTGTVPPTGFHQFYFFVLSVYLAIVAYYFYRKHKASKPVTVKEFEKEMLR